MIQLFFSLLDFSFKSVSLIEKKSELRNGVSMHLVNGTSEGVGTGEVEEEREWNDEDFDILKKQIPNHLVGMLWQWEQIMEAFRGRHGVDSMIKMTKCLQEKRLKVENFFAQRFRQSKWLNKWAEAADPELSIAVP